MTAYNKSTDFAIKDSLLSGNPSKLVRGSEIDTEFVAIQAADADNVKTSGLASGVATFLGTPTSANLAAVLTDETGTGAAVFAGSPALTGTPTAPTAAAATNTTQVATTAHVFAERTNTATLTNKTLTSPVLTTPALGTPSGGVLTNCTGTAAGLTAGNVTTNANLTGHITSVGNAAVLGSFTSLQLKTALTDETGSGAAVFATSPTLVTPALGTPSSGVVTNLTGTASININGTVGATTPAAGTFTTLTSTGLVTLAQGQIKFPATQNASADANTLDDYEEGVWTAGITFGGAAVGVTYTNTTGLYTKVGRVVTASCFLVLSSKGSSTGALLVTGLPFAASSAMLYAGSLRLNNVTSGVGDSALGCNVLNSGSTIILYKYSAGTSAQLTDADISNTSVFVLNVTYDI